MLASKGKAATAVVLALGSASLVDGKLQALQAIKTEKASFNYGGYGPPVGRFFSSDEKLNPAQVVLLFPAQ